MPSHQLPVVQHPAKLQDVLTPLRSKGPVAFIPTMGALHAGHISLVKRARKETPIIVASIFVNPTQFAPGEDFDAYPRTFEADCAKLEAAGCSVVYAPRSSDMYSDTHATFVKVKGVGDGLETDFRPGFFTGVATVVTKLFVRIRPDIAVFGEKDYQQLAVIRALTRDLDLGVEIIGAPTSRDADGLARSSRNAYLSQEERRRAPKLYAVLQRVARQAEDGAVLDRIERNARAALRRAGFRKVDYVSVRHADTLAPFPENRVTGPARVLGAAWMGKTRLIDNLAVRP